MTINDKKRAWALGTGLAVALAGSAVASERNRTSTDAGAAAAPELAALEAPATLFRDLGNESGILQLQNGQQMKIYADGRIIYDEIVEAFGSLERAQFEMDQANVPSTLGPDGTRIYANGAIGYFRDLLGSDMPVPPARNAEEEKQDTPWIQVTMDGTTILSFANGAMFNDPKVNQGVPAWASHRATVPHKVDASGRRWYADGSLFWGEPPSDPQDGQ